MKLEAELPHRLAPVIAAWHPSRDNPGDRPSDVLSESSPVPRPIYARSPSAEYPDERICQNLLRRSVYNNVWNGSLLWWFLLRLSMPRFVVSITGFIMPRESFHGKTFFEWKQEVVPDLKDVKQQLKRSGVEIRQEPSKTAFQDWKLQILGVWKISDSQNCVWNQQLANNGTNSFVIMVDKGDTSMIQSVVIILWMFCGSLYIAQFAPDIRRLSVSCRLQGLASWDNIYGCGKQQTSANEALM